MTEKFNRYNIREVDHTKFGGIIYESDFYTTKRKETNNYNGSPIADRIIRDRRFDERCKKNILSRKNRGNKK